MPRQCEYENGRYLESEAQEETLARISAAGQDTALWQVAWDSDLVAGQVLPMVEKGRTFMYEISVRPAWRRRGLARALLIRALHDFQARGEHVVRLSTVAEFRTRARDLYTSVGFRVLKEFPRYRKPA